VRHRADERQPRCGGDAVGEAQQLVGVARAESAHADVELEVDADRAPGAGRDGLLEPLHRRRAPDDDVGRRVEGEPQLLVAERPERQHGHVARVDPRGAQLDRLAG
jgi:hypothetical protein